MNIEVFILLCMIFCHVVDDFCLQPGCLSFLKQKDWWDKNAPEELYKKDYLMALFVHSFSWAFMIMLPLCVYSFVVACLIVILGLAQLIVNFDSSEVIEKELDSLNQSTISINKTDPTDEELLVYDETKIIDITEEDIKAFYDDGYTGKIYKLLSIGLDYGPQSDMTHYHKENTLNPALVYHSGTRGVLVTEEEYVKSIYGITGDIEYLALADEIKPYGIYITDYSADAIKRYNTLGFYEYENVVGVHKSMGVSVYAYVNGIIKTGYSEKYADVISQLEDVNISAEELAEITKGERFLAYYDDVIQNYSVSYTFNPNFREDFLASQARKWVPVGNGVMTFNGIPLELPDRMYFQVYSQMNKYDLKDNEITLTVDYYNSIFKTNYQSSNVSSFVPHEVTFTYYHHYDELRVKPLKTFTVKIVALSADRAYCSDAVFNELLDVTTFTKGLYFSDISQTKNVFNTAKNNGFMPNSILAYSIATMTKAVDVFSDFFNIIFLGLCACAFVILINYGLKLVKERKHDIGVLKALGIKDKDLTIIFGIHITILIILVIALYIVGSMVFIDLSNESG